MTLTYPEAVARLSSQAGVKPGLERITALLDGLGDPGSGLKGVLVAGTNGKGSVCAIVDAICRESGLRTVMLTNPHLRSYCERVTIDGQDITEEHFASLVEEVLEVAGRTCLRSEMPTQFEVLTAVGLLACRRARAEVTVCEVGLGGRLDSTNVLDLGVSAITNVALDHEQFLGTSIAEIAAEKAGIIKPGNAVVTAAVGPALEIVRARCGQVGASLTVVGEDLVVTGTSLGRRGVTVRGGLAGSRELQVTVPLRGEHQIGNVAVALGVCERLRERGVVIDDGAVVRGAAGTRWPGRMEWRDGAPALLLDGAHNPAGMEAFVRGAADLCGQRPVVAVFAAMADKNIAAMLAALRRLTAVAVMAALPQERAADVEELARRWGENATTATSVRSALTAARSLAGPGGVVAVCGSLYLIGDVLAEVDGGPPG